MKKERKLSHLTIKNKTLPLYSYLLFLVISSLHLLYPIVYPIKYINTAITAIYVPIFSLINFFYFKTKQITYLFHQQNLKQTVHFVSHLSKPPE
jgi:hypothetical protein